MEYAFKLYKHTKSGPNIYSVHKSIDIYPKISATLNETDQHRQEAEDVGYMYYIYKIQSTHSDL